MTPSPVSPPSVPVEDPLEDSVSVIIPCYNAARYLPRAVASALEQTGIGPLQVVLVDDASTDGTADVIADLAARHDAVEGHANARNMGPAGTRNNALSRASGTWIAVLDADDAYAPGRLARLIEVARREALDAIADLPVYYDLAADCPAPQQLPADGSLSRMAFADFLVPDPASGLDPGLLKPVYHRRLLERGILRYPETARHGEDCLLYIALTRAGAAFGFLREARYIFSTRVGAVSGAFSPGSVTDVDYLLLARQAEELRASLAEEGIADEAILQRLDARRAHVLQLNRRYGWTLLRKAELRRLRAWLRQSPQNRRHLLDILVAKLKGHRGLPD
jgi:succinoglycan biosynthesis protein ExoO|tara:strand:- start:953 stop:1960 length:1008 start_codon:yes stop_codon:yes gene_type:complete